MIMEKKSRHALSAGNARSPAVKALLIVAITNFLKVPELASTQCARRGLVCSVPNESHRGIRKPKPVAETIIDVEDEELHLHKNGRKNCKTEGRGPIEWIVAVDAAVICQCPVAWAARLAALELKQVEPDAAAAPAVANADDAADIAEVAAEAGISLARKLLHALHPSSRSEGCPSAVPLPSQLVRAATV
ncbi:hypothetical protein FRB90_005059 [Tulasnella sp. 427]|nr:hypothetical protein FRB90_005059 [Tulasnella sp. 427]